MSSQKNIPSTILIIGSGAFGLTTLYELLQRPSYSSTSFVLLSPTLPNVQRTTPCDPRHDRSLTASVDSTRIIRADYADPLYAQLCRQALEGWRNGWGDNGRYSESGLLLSGDKGTPGALYIAKSLAIAKQSPGGARIRELKTASDISRAMGTEGANGTGQLGCLNQGGGWADAGACMDWLFKQVLTIENGRLRTIDATVEGLTVGTSAQGSMIVTGAVTSSGDHVCADQTVLATGAWTPTLLDCSGLASPRGLSVAYIDLTEEEASKLHSLPVHLNLSTGCFLFPPTKRKSDGVWEMKIAQHGFGYMGTEVDVDVLGDDGQVHTHTARLPAFPEKLPPKDRKLLLDFLDEALPTMRPVWAAASRGERSMKSRICWYLDTAAGDFVICHHPSFDKTLFVATGGSGHAFKMTPALGTHIVDVLDGTDERKNGGVWTQKWRWPERAGECEVWCHDGSRAGTQGLALQDALESRALPRESRL